MLLIRGTKYYKRNARVHSQIGRRKQSTESPPNSATQLRRPKATEIPKMKLYNEIRIDTTYTLAKLPSGEPLQVQERGAPICYQIMYRMNVMYKKTISYHPPMSYNHATAVAVNDALIHP